MLQTIEATIDMNGVRLMETIRIAEPHRAIVTILEPIKTANAPEFDTAEFEADMKVFVEGTENLPAYTGTYSREEIYFDHD